MASDTPPTIAELIARLGPPRNYAEQALIADLRLLESRHAELEAQAEDEALSSFRRERVRFDALVVWFEAHTMAATIATYRKDGHVAVIPGVYGVPATTADG